MKKIIYGLLITCMLTTCKKPPNPTKPQAIRNENTQMASVYHCPMNCEKAKTYDKPGICPVCKMDLEKSEVKK